MFENEDQSEKSSMYSELNEEERFFIKKIKNEDVIEIKNYLKIETPNNIHKIWEYKTQENDNSNVLHLSIFVNNYKIIKMIIKYCENNLNETDFFKFIDTQNEKGIKPIHLASFRGNVKLIHYLLKKGCSINSLTKRSLNLIHFACQGNRPNSLCYFYYFHKNEIEMEMRDLGGTTPLHWACYSSSAEALTYLLQWGVGGINKQDNLGLTPLHLGIIANSIRIVRILLQNGADINIKKNSGESPFDLAKNAKNKQLFEMMKKNGKKFEICNFKAPLKKITRSKKFIYILTAVQLISAFILLCVIFPALINHKDFLIKKSIINKNKTVLFMKKYFYNYSIISYLIFTIIFIILYLYLIFSDPGYMRKISEDEIKERILRNESFKKFCIKCQVYLTDNSKHCVICDKCCDEFDHHCFWINNCIGKNNYNTFISFLSIIFIDLLDVLLIGIITLDIILDPYPKEKDHHNYEICTLDYLKKFSNIIDIPYCFEFLGDGILQKIFVIILICIALFFMVPLILIFRLHIKVCLYRIEKERIDRNRRRSTVNSFNRVNTSDLLKSEDSGSDSSSL